MPLLPIIIGIGAGLTALGLFGYAIYRTCFANNGNQGGGYVDLTPMYEALQANAHLAPNPQQVANWVNSPGGQVINNRVLGAPSHNNVLNFSNHLHTTLAQNNLWTWHPVACTFTGAELLDGVENSGECRIPAEALKTLFSSPAPYGYQLNAADFVVSTYAGAHGAGFIADHANTVLGLEANTWRANGNRVGFYNWMNHKTVRYTAPDHVTRYYDPSYSTAEGGLGFYPNEPAMAVAQIAGDIQFNAATFVGKHVFGVTKTDDANTPHKGFYIAVARDPINGNLPTSQQFNANQDAYKVAFVGPFNATTSNSANDFGFNNANDYLAGINNLPN